MGETKDENVEKSVSNISGSILVSGVRSRDDGGKPDLFLVLRESVEDTHGGLHRHCLAVFVIFAYITNRTFVFRSQNSGLAAILREMTAFFGARIFSGALDVALMVIFVDGCICRKCG